MSNNTGHAIIHMADSFGKKEREKKKARKKKDKEQRKAERKSEGKQTEVFMYVDAYGNFTETKPEFVEADLEDVGQMNNSGASAKPKLSGTVKFVDPEKRFGFIQTNGKWGDVYFNLPEGVDQIPAGTKVHFDIEKTEKGARATDLTF